MNIAPKLTLSYLLAAGCLFLLGLTGFQSTSQIRCEFNNVVKRRRPVTGALQELKYSTVRLASATSELVLS